MSLGVLSAPPMDFTSASVVFCAPAAAEFSMSAATCAIFPAPTSTSFFSHRGPSPRKLGPYDCGYYRGSYELRSSTNDSLTNFLRGVPTSP